ncbi:hypothetical protein [Streptomyces sp. SP18CS02]|uniref:hypothetical protein n=1 Tax=Streptomyces sp. SP18CS02 TaxID=3002531 RepID=UPI002E7A39A9|nr:hypothetical protein [Streptomyces sp. SP18CS02]MEE1754938.1 hypothetical protein [Streptomyces sp. SP18CS02]
MRFAQIIDLETERMDEVEAVLQQRRARMAGGEGGPRHRTVLKDRARPNRYLMIVEFDSHEAAMRNSGDPQTTEMARAIGAQCSRAPVFTDCDVLVREDVR